MQTFVKRPGRRRILGAAAAVVVAAPWARWAAGQSAAARWDAAWTRTSASLAWTELAVGLIAKYRLNPLRAARMLAYLHTAMHDAARVEPDRVAVPAAAARVLAHFFPAEPGGRFAALGAAAIAAVAGIDEAEGARAAQAGRAAAQRAIDRALRDGADRLAPVQPPPGPGVWRAAPPLFIHRPLEPLAGDWPTWVLGDPLRFEPPPPHAYGSAAFLAEVREVKAVADDLTAADRAIADRWDLDRGTATPAGVWNLIARDAVERRRLDTRAAAKVFDALNAALLDAFVACWKVKYKWWTERPVTAIRAAIDPAFLPHLVTPPFPAYVSGHSSASGAAAEVLAAAFPDERARFERDAREAAHSRLLGGIHFRSDNDRGLEMGQQIGRLVADRKLGATR